MEWKFCVRQTWRNSKLFSVLSAEGVELPSRERPAAVPLAGDAVDALITDPLLAAAAGSPTTALPAQDLLGALAFRAGRTILASGGHRSSFVPAVPGVMILCTASGGGQTQDG